MEAGWQIFSENMCSIHAATTINSLHLTPRDLSGSQDEELCIRHWISSCIFHKTNISLWGQDVVATPSTITVIYTPGQQAETDADDLKMEICGNIMWEILSLLGWYNLRRERACLSQFLDGTLNKKSDFGQTPFTGWSKIMSKIMLCNTVQLKQKKKFTYFIFWQPVAIFLGV